MRIIMKNMEKLVGKYEINKNKNLLLILSDF